MCTCWASDAVSHGASHRPLPRVCAVAPCVVLRTVQTITFALKSHMRDGPRAACLSRLLPGIMEGLAGLIEGLPPALAPFASRGGPVLDARAMDRVLNAMYRDVTAAVRSAKAAGKQARQAVAAPL